MNCGSIRYTHVATAPSARESSSLANWVAISITTADVESSEEQAHEALVVIGTLDRGTSDAVISDGGSKHLARSAVQQALVKLDVTSGVLLWIDADNAVSD